MKGSGTVGQFEQLDQLLETQDGMLRTAQVVSAGISKPVFMIMCTHGNWSGSRMEFIFPRMPGRCHVLTSSAGRTGSVFP